MGMTVIGSGPAAIATTRALVEQGHHVTILDVGTCLDAGRQELVDRMAAQEPECWSDDDLEAAIGERSITRDAVHSKLSFGSAYSFDTRAAAVNVLWGENSGFNHSLARGGLSNVWGSSLLPYRQEDIEDWPVSISELEPHYRAVMDFVPNSAVTDDLEKLLPSYSTRSHSLPPSAQGKALLEDLEKRKLPLRRSGIHFGRSRLAIRASGDATHRDCALCTLCLSGCPYGLIYSSAETLAELIRDGFVTYLPNHLVETFKQSGDHVTIIGRNLETQLPFSHLARRVFLGAGVLPTAKIVLKSLNVFDNPVVLRDSQYFIYPLLRFSLTNRVETERMHTSSQAFLEIEDNRVSNHLVHLQIYGYSSFLHHELNRTFLRWPLKLVAFRRHFLGRLLIAQGFLHSKESGSVELILRKSTDGKTSLDACPRRSRGAFVRTLRVGWKLLGQSLNLRAIPLIPGLKFPDPGSGYHSGGTFPMRRTPQPLETDVLGRFPSIDRVHLVDSSILPSIPATSITFSVMANAHRIASLAGRLDPL